MPQSKVISLYPQNEKSPNVVEKQPVKPWERQPHEPASLFLRFTAYRLLGRKRSLQALVDSDKQEQEALKSTKKKSRVESNSLHEVKSPVPGALRAACKKWRWVERAAAWDLDQIRKKEAFWDMVLKDGTIEYAQSGRRINLLSGYVVCLEKHLETNDVSFERQMEIFKMISQLLRQIEHEMLSRLLLTKA